MKKYLKIFAIFVVVILCEVYAAQKNDGSANLIEDDPSTKNFSVVTTSLERTIQSPANLVGLIKEIAIKNSTVSNITNNTKSESHETSAGAPENIKDNTENIPDLKKIAETQSSIEGSDSFKNKTEDDQPSKADNISNNLPVSPSEITTNKTEESKCNGTSCVKKDLDDEINLEDIEIESSKEVSKASRPTDQSDSEEEDEDYDSDESSESEEEVLPVEVTTPKIIEIEKNKTLSNPLYHAKKVKMINKEKTKGEQNSSPTTKQPDFKSTTHPEDETTPKPQENSKLTKNIETTTNPITVYITQASVNQTEGPNDMKPEAQTTSSEDDSKQLTSESTNQNILGSYSDQYLSNSIQRQEPPSTPLIALVFFASLFVFVSALGIYYRKISYMRRRYGGHVPLTQEEDPSYVNFNRETLYESWSDIPVV